MSILFELSRESNTAKLTKFCERFGAEEPSLFALSLVKLLPKLIGVEKSEK
jgi:hypothetical protein